MSSLYSVGDTILVRLGGMECEEITIKGVVEEVRSGNPPRYSPLLPDDRYCYKLEGYPNYYRESSVVESLCIAA